MGYVNMKEDSGSLEIISQALSRRNLYWDEEDDWEVHGPHPSGNYQVFTGTAYTSKSKKREESFLVKITPRGVWQIADSSDWWKKDDPESLIRVGKK